ncbi:LRR receptor-like serine threonine-protein kinase [Seminavis robusta]|uniref:LRR receptor-like serine threonine-protein kinase n=1 Tax=Seminavis robusta TaxID=568900 RepID=A0A9N8E0E1_9STRA|nr:LRR receptor-like serine threonine-protein kinase [Seminavis robusta]|eukprot:Sro425_g140240.1 LRR receptor-like serine threonine-protein kinase (1066) ;mRNA; f:57855-61443
MSTKSQEPSGWRFRFEWESEEDDEDSEDVASEHGGPALMAGSDPSMVPSPPEKTNEKVHQDNVGNLDAKSNSGRTDQASWKSLISEELDTDGGATKKKDDIRTQAKAPSSSDHSNPRTTTTTPTPGTTPLAAVDSHQTPTTKRELGERKAKRISTSEKASGVVGAVAIEGADSKSTAEEKGHLISPINSQSSEEIIQQRTGKLRGKKRGYPHKLPVPSHEERFSTTEGHQRQQSDPNAPLPSGLAKKTPEQARTLRVSVAAASSMPTATAGEQTGTPTSSLHRKKMAIQERVHHQGTIVTNGVAIAEEEEADEEDIERPASHDHQPAQPDDQDISVQTSTANLAVANPVTEDDLQQAQEWHERPIRTRNKLACCRRPRWHELAALVFVIAGAVAIASIVGVEQRNNDDQPDTDAQDEVIMPGQPTAAMADRVRSLLPDYSLQAIDRSDNSPQMLAYEWLMGDPNLETYPDWRTVQRFSLATIYFSLGGNEARGWVQDTGWISYDVHECEWFQSEPEAAAAADDPSFGSGTTYTIFNVSRLDSNVCTGETGEEYQHLLLLSNGLQGSIPEELYLLSSLKTISLRGNIATGSISSRVGLLTSLFALDVTANRMTSTLPTEIGLLTNLTALSTVFNPAMTGSIPSTVGNLYDLGILGLDSCSYSGVIPTEIGRLRRLYWLLLYNNRFSGQLPSELGLLRSPTFHLFNNSLTGTIPSELGNVQYMSFLTLGDNPALEGNIPSEFGQLEYIWMLGIWNTNVSGPIPTEFGRLLGLSGLLLANNRLHGSIPSELGNLKSLWGLGLFGNGLSGAIPSELSSISDLAALALQDNILTGHIPTEFGVFSEQDGFLKMELLDLSGNHMSGNVPSELGLITSLRELSLHNNQLTGSVPSTLGNLFRRAYSYVEFLFASGSLPDIFASIIPSRSLSLDNNRLVGSLPTELGGMTSLLNFSISNNSLTGGIPEQLGNMESLESLNLADNNLRGPVPSELGLLSELISLSLADNELSGKLPTEVGTLVASKEPGASFENLNISGNGFSGTIPLDVCLAGSNALSFDCSDSLCGCDCSCS